MTTGCDPKTVRNWATVTAPAVTAATITTGSHTRLISLFIVTFPDADRVRPTTQFQVAKLIM
ncbi:hypothetical protein MALGJ_08410 [Mycolicibacter algericus]|uniref:Uncharacterized protein n=1 Tax=Mycolicibacter algericus TaxID=1288388 RepID=A0A7I9Y665_MYCAL|nr:hypothetical protein MALGJ_08410 [Mycolicibacter algericus]